MVDPRVTCERCKQRKAELEAAKTPAHRVYEVGNPASPGMGHMYYFTSTGRIALCIADKCK